MKLQGKLSYSILLVGLVFTFLFLAFIYINTQIDHIREERRNIDRLLISWQDLTDAANRLYISEQHLKVRSEWNRYLESFTNQYELFYASQLKVFELQEGDLHFQKLHDLNRTWSSLLGEFSLISLQLQEPELDFLARQGGALAYYHTHPEELNENQKLLIERIGKKLVYMDISRSLFISSLRDISYYIDKELEQRTKLYRSWIFTAFCISSLGAITFAFLFSRRMAQRLIQVESGIQKVAQGDFSVRLNIQSGDEFQLLSEHFNGFMVELKQRFTGSLSIMQNILGDLDYDSGDKELFKGIIEASCDLVNAQCGAIVLLNNETQQLEVVSTHGYFTPLRQINGQELFDLAQLDSHFREAALDISRDSLWYDILKDRTPYIIKDSSTVEDFPLKDSGDLGYLSALMIVPLSISGRALGLIAVACREKEQIFTDLQVNQFIPFTEYAGIALDNFQKYKAFADKKQHEQDLLTAGSIQRDLLPHILPTIKGFDAAGYSLPSSEVRGDYFDMIPFKSGNFSIFIGDVSTKGISASLGTVILRTVYHLVASDKRVPSQQLSFLNRSLVETNILDNDATASMIHVLPNEKKILYANAAHLPLLYFDSFNNSFKEIQQNDTQPLGLDITSKYSNRELAFKEGDFFVLYTNGITDTKNPQGETFGLKRFAAVLQQFRKLEARKMLEKVRIELNYFSQEIPQEDDQTMLILKYQPKLQWEEETEISL